MIGNNLNSQFVLVDSVSATDAAAIQFGQNVEWLAPDLFAVTSDLFTPWVADDLGFSDGTYFDGGSTEFGQLFNTPSQKVDIFQVLDTKRNWIDSQSDILNPVPVATIPVTGASASDVVYSGAIDNLFLVDPGNPSESIKIFNNPALSHGWTVFTAQQHRLDPGSISQAWIYDSITNIKLSDLEVVDLYAGVLPGAIASELDFVCDIDPAVYNTPLWGPSVIYNIGDVVVYNGKTYQALFAGKSGSTFNPALWSVVSTQPNFSLTGSTKWGSEQVGRTWFNTNDLKAVNAQLGDLTQRAQNWNTWFPNSSIQVFEWVTSNVAPSAFTGNATTGFVSSPTIPFTFDPATSTYGFWVYGKNVPSQLHDAAITQIVASLISIPNSGIPMITAIDKNAVAVWNINQFVSSNTVVLHIDYVTESADNLLHNEFTLISNDGTKSWYPTSIYPKLVDSLSGVSTTNQLVPDYTIPLSQQTGILTNPVQSLFVDRITAVDIYFTVINQQLANVAIATTAVVEALSAFDPLPTTGFNEQIPDRAVLAGLDPSLYPENYRILITEDDTLNPVAWSIVAIVDGQWQFAQYQLYNLANNWEYSDWFAPNYTTAPPTFVLDNPGELSQITYGVGDIIQINNMGNGNESIFLAIQNDIDPAVIELDPIFIQNGTIQFLPNLYDFLSSGIGFDNQGFDSQGLDNDPYLPIRLITQILNSTIFVGSQSLLLAADQAFYAALNFILFENQNLDWLFKTSFITVDYDNRSLNVQGNYEPDNQAAIEDFISETLPYHTRVREFRDTYSASDYGNIGAVDFDLPAQFDGSYANIILQYTANPKLNGVFPLSAFLPNVGVFRDARSSYVRSNGIAAQPTMPANVQNWTFGIVTSPITSNVKFDTVPNTLGPIAVAIDGIPMFSPNSGIKETLYLYGNSGNVFANIATNATFTINSVQAAYNENLDPGAGYTNSNGQYQYSIYPYILDPFQEPITHHSKIVGYAWDGNPIYGPFGYKNANGTGGLIFNTSSYQLSTTPRLSANGGAFVNGLLFGNLATPDGTYIEDFVYEPGSGTLDECNGRFVVTPDYPNGVYAYFCSIEESPDSEPTYPYILGPAYNSRPFGLKYTYINGNNTPVYLNGNVTIPQTPFIDSVDLTRSPDGTVSSDPVTLMQPVYAPWNNNHSYSIGDVIVERPGAGYLNLNSNIVVTPTNNANIVVSSLLAVNATMVLAGENYKIGDILVLDGGTYVNSANIVVTNVNLGSSNAITGFELVSGTPQGYTVLPSNVANVTTTSLTSNGSGAYFNVSFGIESVKTVDGGDSFLSTPSIVVIDSNATTAANLYPVLENDLVRGISTTIAFNRVSRSNSNVQYSGVVMDAGQFVPSYRVPTGTIFDQNDGWAAKVALNISWRPELISDTALSTDFSRFGNSSGVFDNLTGQYITANANSTGISNISINANSFTLEFFMNFSNLEIPLGVLVDTRANITSSTGLVVFNNGGNLCVGSNTNVAVISSNTIPFTTNQWQFVTVNGGSGNIFMYMNGQLVGNAMVPYNYSDDGFTMGADVSGGNVCTGYMDEIRLTCQHNRYELGIININVPVEEFPRSIANDPYLLPQYTPILWGFENFINESEAVITFNSINSETLISDLSWNQKKLQLVNYGANLVINTTTINTIESPRTSEILSVILNQDLVS